MTVTELWPMPFLAKKNAVMSKTYIEQHLLLLFRFVFLGLTPILVHISVNLNVPFFRIPFYFCLSPLPVFDFRWDNMVVFLDTHISSNNHNWLVKIWLLFGSLYLFVDMLENEIKTYQKLKKKKKRFGF